MFWCLWRNVISQINQIRSEIYVRFYQFLCLRYSFDSLVHYVLQEQSAEKSKYLNNQPEKKKWEKAYSFPRVEVLLHVWTLFHIYLSVSGDCSSGWNAKIQENHSSGIRFHKMTTFVSHSKLYIEWKQIGHAHWLLAKRVNAVDIVYSFKCQQSSSFLFLLEYFFPISSLWLNALKL